MIFFTVTFRKFLLWVRHYFLHRNQDKKSFKIRTLFGTLFNVKSLAIPALACGKRPFYLYYFPHFILYNTSPVFAFFPYTLIFHPALNRISTSIYYGRGARFDSYFLSRVHELLDTEKKGRQMIECRGNTIIREAGGWYAWRSDECRSERNRKETMEEMLRWFEYVLECVYLLFVG